MDLTKLITKNTDPCYEIANTKRTKGLLNSVNGFCTSSGIHV